MESNNDALVTFRDVTKTFRAGKRSVRALRDLTTSVPAGQVTGLIGPDGAGKTTALRIAAGLYVPDAGEASVLGMDVARHALAVQANVGYMPQRFGLYEDLTVQENLDLYADLQGVAHARRADRYRELMVMTGLAPFPNRLAGKLSGGMKQKLGLACVLVHPPRLLLLDEPTVGVDPVSRRELWQIVDRFVQEEGTTVLVSTGYFDEAERCDTLIVLHEGQMLSHGTPASFSEPLAGRTFKVRVEGMKYREVQARLNDCEELVDAVIQGEGVRIVTRQACDASVIPCQELLPESSQATVRPEAPRFEDAFVAMLGDHRQAGRKPAKSSSQEQGESQQRYVSHGDADAPVIQVNDVKRRFGDFYAVKGVTFDVERGEIFGLLGANGAGKTTTFRMLCGLLPASEGKLYVAGVDVRRTAVKARARIGYMAQKFSLYGSLSVMDNLRFFSSAYRLEGKRRQARIHWALQEFELESVANTNSGDLPLGYKQRLSFACALMHEPEILFLDEPTSGVDPLARREFWRRTNALTTRGVTVLVTTHFMEEAENCDRLVIMSEGEVLAQGAPAAIKRRMQTADNPEPTMEDAFIQLIESRTPS